MNMRHGIIGLVAEVGERKWLFLGYSYYEKRWFESIVIYKVKSRRFFLYIDINWLR